MESKIKWAAINYVVYILFMAVLFYAVGYGFWLAGYKEGRYTGIEIGRAQECWRQREIRSKMLEKIEPACQEWRVPSPAPPPDYYIIEDEWPLDIAYACVGITDKVVLEQYILDRLENKKAPIVTRGR